MPESIEMNASFDVIEPLANAIVDSVEHARGFGAVFPGGSSPEVVFREAVASAIHAIEVRGTLLRDFLALGPFEGDGPIPPALAGQRLSDEDCTRAITLIYAHAINCFKGALAELLALKPAVRLIEDLQRERQLPSAAQLWLGDAVMPVRRGSGAAKGADLHLLSDSLEEPALLCVAEVKSYPVNPARLRRQLNAHAARAAKGIRIISPGAEARVIVPRHAEVGPLMISAAPSAWHLSRDFRFVDEDGRTFLHFAPLPAIPEDRAAAIDPRHWHITLGWSQEALASQAYSMTYWYMQELGRELFTERSPWPGMTPEQAGTNATVQSLYYAIRRCVTPRSEQRAIALYNAYGFGYALGTSFRDSSGRRQMLWPEQLREIMEAGATSDGFRLHP